MAIDIDCREWAGGSGHKLKLYLEEYLLKALYGRWFGFWVGLEAKEKTGEGCNFVSYKSSIATLHCGRAIFQNTPGSNRKCWRT